MGRARSRCGSLPPARAAAAATLTATSRRSATATDSLTGTGEAPGHLYWTDFGTNGLSNGTVMKANRDGSNPQVIESGQGGPDGVAVDSSHLYWADAGAGTVMEANLDGSSLRVIESGQSQPFGVAMGP